MLFLPFDTAATGVLLNLLSAAVCVLLCFAPDMFLLRVREMSCAQGGRAEKAECEGEKDVTYVGGFPGALIEIP